MTEPVQPPSPGPSPASGPPADAVYPVYGDFGETVEHDPGAGAPRRAVYNAAATRQRGGPLAVVVFAIIALIFLVVFAVVLAGMWSWFHQDEPTFDDDSGFDIPVQIIVS